ncbi:YraN family protein [Meridianimarinicoccus sp. RP-17]|uniref:YraN family protein n=1 Tax=Meridianimarinicoccus zhengii TaxID=2056810 RepID=UPI001F31B897|nr:YraN family protein [Phycocomes zhengii]
MADFAGRSAEAIVSRHYQDRGAQLLVCRWRGTGGEIDLIFEHAGATVFVEVKKAADFAAASARIGPRQIARLSQAAEEYLGRHAGSVAAECRFDVALVDRVGRVQVLENAFA